MNESTLHRAPTVCRNSNSHLWRLPCTQALCLDVFESSLCRSHIAECSWIFETHDTTNGHLLFLSLSADEDTRGRQSAWLAA